MTLKEIAQQAGVSVSTVSRVLNGNAAGAAGEELQKKIWEIANRGGYTPNQHARSLRTGAADAVRPGRTIACLYARRTSDPDDAFFTSITFALEREALAQGCSVKYSFTAFDVNTPAMTAALMEEHPDGIIVLGRSESDTLSYLEKHFHSVVSVSLNQVPDRFDQIVCDGYAIGTEIMEKLYGRGHRRIAYIGEISNEVRYAAYRDFCKAHGIFDPALVSGTVVSAEAGYEGAGVLFKKGIPVDAVFCMGDIIAIGAFRAAREAKLKIPGDVAIMSVDDIEAGQFLSPMLSSVRIPKEEMGRLAVKLLLDKINRGHTEPLFIRLPYHMIERESFRWSS